MQTGEVLGNINETLGAVRAAAVRRIKAPSPIWANVISSAAAPRMWQ